MSSARRSSVAGAGGLGKTDGKEFDAQSAFFEASLDMLAVAGFDGYFKRLNGAWPRILGHPVEELLSSPYIDFVHPEDRERTRADAAMLTNAKGDTIAFENRYRASDGSYRSLLWSAKADPAKQLIYGVAKDVTERERSEAALRSSDQLKAGILSSALDCIVIIDEQGLVVEFNPAAERTFGYRRAEVLGREMAELIIPPGMRDAHRRGLAHLAATGEGRVLNRRLELEGQRSDGAVFPVELTITRLQTDPPRFTGFLRDISDRKQMETALRNSAEEIRDLYDNAPCGYHSIDAEGTFLSINATALEWFGYARDEIVGKLKITDLLTPESVAVFREAFPRGRESGELHELELQLVRKDGTTFPVLLSATAITDAGGNFVRSRSTMFDISERKRLEARTRQAERMESVGQLAGGIAHDFNNLLAVIINYSEFLADALRDDDKLHDDLREILGAADRAADLTRRLLAFSHHQTVQPEVIDLNVVISEMQKLLSRTIGEHVVLETRLHPELAPIKADPSQVEQILLNLVVNARDAMPDGGTARIETEAVELDATYAETHPYTAPGDYVRLTVSDNGTGMDAEVAEHAFDPFFTTKPTGKGTGLGLATVYGAVRQAGGSIDIYTEPGLGTTFKLYFPLTAEHRVERARDNGAGHGHHKASGTVLVVEDEDAVRKLTVRILHDHGFEVIEAADPQKAFTLLEPHRVDLLLTDVIMPGMSGTKLAEQLVGLRPDLKVVYMSGYTDDFLAHQGILEQGISLVEKPFTAKALISSVCAALAGGHDEAKEE